MKSQRNQTISLMGFFFGIKPVHTDRLAVEHNRCPVFSSPTWRHAFRSVFFLLVVFVLAVLARRANAEVFPSVVSRIAVFVVNEMSIRNLDSLQRENNSVNGWVQLVPLVSEFYPFGRNAASGSVPVNGNRGLSSSASSIEPHPRILFLEVRARPLLPSQDSGFLVVREALLQILPGRENDQQFHNQQFDCGIRCIWEPNTPRCAAYFSFGVTNFNT